MLRIDELCSLARALGAIFGLVLFLPGCATYPGWLPSAGASRQQVLEVKSAQPDLPIQVVALSEAISRRLVAGQRKNLFSETFGNKGPVAYNVGPGDVVEVSVWEAPPAALFGANFIDPRGTSASARVTSFPEQMIGKDGTINIPFAGSIPVSGKALREIEFEIVRRLTGKANQPQVLVRVIRNATSNVTVVGEVTGSTRMPLTARGERLLDALAAAGGVRQPVGKTMLQVTRADQVHALALDTIIRDPNQNILLQPGDVITALFQPFSFTVLGATSKNEEINFEGQGITLAQALARAGGLQDARADARAVFIFRFENPGVLESQTQMKTMPDGRVPVVYQLDLTDPGSFFVSQSFPMFNRDVMYVSNAPAAELQKFMNILYSGVYSATTVRSAVRP